MKKSNRFNNLSDKLLKSIPPLKKGDSVSFTLLDIAIDPVTGNEIIQEQNVPSTDTIFDGDTPVDIAALQSVNSTGKEKFDVIWFERSAGGVITLNGNTPAHQERYMYLMLCNYNLSNPNRDTTKQPIFKTIDAIGDAKRKSEELRVRHDAITLAISLPDDEVRTIISARGGNDRAPIETLRAQLEQLAFDDPTGFKASAMSKVNELRALVQRSLDSGVIKFDGRTNKFSWGKGGDEIVTVARGTGVDKITGMVEFLTGTDQGSAVAKELDKQLKLTSK